MAPLLLALLTNTVLAASLGALARVVDRGLRRPAFAHALYVIALLALVAPPLVSVGSWSPGDGVRPASGVATERRDPAELPGMTTAAPRPAAQSPSDRAPAANPGAIPGGAPADPLPWSALLLALWGAGSLLAVLLLAVRCRALVRVMRSGRPADPETTAELAARAAEAGLRRAPAAVCIAASQPPSVVPTLRGARMLLPADWTTRYDAATRSALLRHECAHLRRGDHRLRLLEALLTVFAWWHPLLWWLRAALRDAEERACDSWVVAGSDARVRRSYCESLLTAASLRPTGRAALLALTTGVVRGASDSPRMRAWSRRLENVMNRETPPRCGRAERILVLAAALVFLPFGIAQDPASALPTDLLTHLKQTRFAWSVEDASSQEWVADLAREIGRPVELTPRAHASEATRITGLRLPVASAQQVLDIAGTLTGLCWNVVDGRVRFDVPEPDSGSVADRVTVRLLGAVRRPGPHELPAPATVLDLLADVELAEQADVSSVRLLRPATDAGEGEAALVLDLDVRGMIESGDTTQNVMLQTGDIVQVGEHHPELPELFLRVGSRLHFAVPASLVEQPGCEQLSLLSASQPVGRDGTIFVPYCGSVYVLGMTRETVSEVVSKALGRLFTMPIRLEARFDPPK